METFVGIIFNPNGSVFGQWEDPSFERAKARIDALRIPKGGKAIIRDGSGKILVMKDGNSWYRWQDRGAMETTMAMSPQHAAGPMSYDAAFQWLTSHGFRPVPGSSRFASSDGKTGRIVEAGSGDKWNVEIEGGGFEVTMGVYFLKQPGSFMASRAEGSSLRDAQEKTWRWYVGRYGEAKMRDLGITGPEWFVEQPPGLGAMENPLADKRAACPYCARSVKLSVFGATPAHYATGGLCDGSNRAVARLDAHGRVVFAGVVSMASDLRGNPLQVGDLVNTHPREGARGIRGRVTKIDGDKIQVETGVGQFYGIGSNVEKETVHEVDPVSMGRPNAQEMCNFCGRYQWTDAGGKFRAHEYPSGGMCKGGGQSPEDLQYEAPAVSMAGGPDAFKPGDRVEWRMSGYGKDAGKIVQGTVVAYNSGPTRDHIRIRQDNGEQDFGYVDLFRELRKI